MLVTRQFSKLFNMSETVVSSEKSKRELTIEQKAEIDRNRQQAIERRNARLASITISELYVH